MAYALLQKHLSAPVGESLQRACRVVPEFRERDAQVAAREACGIFLRGLDVEVASALQDALLREGLETWVVAEAELPAIPPGKIICQVEMQSQHATMRDSRRRTYYVPWQDIMFLAAGNVCLPEAKPIQSGHESSPVHGPGLAAERVTDLNARSELHPHLMLDILLVDGISRYSINADEFVFDHLGHRLSEDRRANFVTLVQDLIKAAPHAGLNRGACLISEQAVETFAYPNQDAFFAEMTWMLWRIDKLNKREDI